MTGRDSRADGRRRSRSRRRRQPHRGQDPAQHTATAGIRTCLGRLEVFHLLQLLTSSRLPLPLLLRGALVILEEPAEEQRRPAKEHAAVRDGERRLFDFEMSVCLAPIGGALQVAAHQRMGEERLEGHQPLVDRLLREPVLGRPALRRQRRQPRHQPRELRVDLAHLSVAGVHGPHGKGFRRRLSSGSRRPHLHPQRVLGPGLGAAERAHRAHPHLRRAHGLHRHARPGRSKWFPWRAQASASDDHRGALLRLRAGAAEGRVAATLGAVRRHVGGRGAGGAARLRALNLRHLQVQRLPCRLLQALAPHLPQQRVPRVKVRRGVGDPVGGGRQGRRRVRDVAVPEHRLRRQRRRSFAHRRVAARRCPAPLRRDWAAAAELGAEGRRRLV